jgi:glycosyltransferase involved in cell wall biosynthesis
MAGMEDSTVFAPVSVVILTFNSEATIGATLDAACAISDDVHVVDSFSTDTTLDIARAHGAHVVQHPFDNYGAQRNWAIETLEFRHGWQLHLDADERLTDALAAEIRAVLADPPAGIDGFYIPRLVYFLGHPIRHGGMYPIYHMRLFRRGKGQCENRRYDQHFYVAGGTRNLDSPMIDDIRMRVGEYFARHVRWAEAEAEEIMNPETAGRVAGRLGGTPVENKRYLRGWYYRAPLFLRGFLLFFYRYVLRLGFLDGRAGLVFFALQALAFRLLVDGIIMERRLTRR